MTTTEDPSPQRSIPRLILWLAALLCALTVTYVYVARLIAPNDLFRKDQGKTMSYTVDVIVNGRFSLPRDSIFQPATKPPLYNWLAATFVGPTGIYAEWAHKMPSLVGTIVVALMLLVWCRRRFSDAFDASHATLLAILAATIWVASKSPILLMYIARPDMVQATCLVAAWLAGHAALSKPTKREATRWTILYWLAVTAAALAKGPAAVYPILYALLAAPLCFGDWRRLRNLRWIPGLLFLFGSVGLWLACAARQDWPHVRDVLLGAEVAQRIAVSRIEGGEKPVHYALMWFISQNTIWSYLMIGSMIVSLLGSVRGLFGGAGIPDSSGTGIPACVRRSGSAVEIPEDSDSANAPPDTGRNACATKFFDALEIRPTEGFFTGAAGAANLWAIVVVGCLSVPKDKRQDFLLPAHPAAAILAAHFIVFLIARHRWARFAIPLGGAVFLLNEKRTVSEAITLLAAVLSIAVVVGIAALIRRRPRLLPIVFAAVAIAFVAFEVLTNTRYGIAKIAPTPSFVLLIVGAGVVGALGLATFRRARLDVPVIAFGTLFWASALIDNQYKETGIPTRLVSDRVEAAALGITDRALRLTVGRSKLERRVAKAHAAASQPTSHGTNPSVYLARFTTAAKEIVGDEPVVCLVRNKSPLLALMGRHQGSVLTRADFERARWVIAERSKFPELVGTPQEALFSGILDVDYGSVRLDQNNIYKDRIALYRIENGRPSVDQLISIFRWVTRWTTKDANPYRSANTGWIEGPNDPPIWTPPPGDPWTDAKLRKKGGRGD